MAGSDPETPEEWQRFVNIMSACLMIDEGIKNRVIPVRKNAPLIDVERCRLLLERGQKMGYRPDDRAAKEIAIELLEEFS